MKRITALLFTAMLVLPSAVIFADDAQNATDQNATDQNVPNLPSMPKNLPKPSDMPVSPALPKGMSMPSMPAIPGIMTKSVVATSDGGIVRVEGNKITKFDKNLEITKSIELTDAGDTGGDKNTKQ